MKINIIKNPLINYYISILRNKKTKSYEFRNAVDKVSALMLGEISKEFITKEQEVETFLGKTTETIYDEEIIIVPILRAALSMLKTYNEFLPNATTHHIGVFRDEENFKPIFYYSKVKNNTSNPIVLIIDPMLATGGSAEYVINHLKEKGYSRFIFINLFAAPEGVEHINKVLPEVKIYTATLDEKLNDKKYIVPGLGDAGDRSFNT